MATTVPQQGADQRAAAGVLAAACVSALVVNANTSAVTILLPAISQDVNAPVAQLQWAVTGYSLVGAAVIVTSGALGDVFGRRKVFLGGLALGVGLIALMARHRMRRSRGVDRAAAAAATAHTIPTPPPESPAAR